MGQANNVARSLQIISRGQGWDPCQIGGEEFKMLEYDDNEQPVAGFKPGPLPPDPQGRTPDPAVPGPDNRSPGAGGKSGGVHDPYGPGNMEG